MACMSPEYGRHLREELLKEWLRIFGSRPGHLFDVTCGGGYLVVLGIMFYFPSNKQAFANLNLFTSHDILLT